MDNRIVKIVEVSASLPASYGYARKRLRVVRCLPNQIMLTAEAFYMGRKIDRSGNHRLSKRQKTGAGSVYQDKLSRKPKPNTSKTLYVYASKDDGTLMAFHARFSSKIMLRYWKPVYTVTVKNTGGKPSNIVGRIVAGVEFGQDGGRFDPL